MTETDSVLPIPVVEVDWLQAHLGQPDLVVLDASVPPVVPGFESVNSESEFHAIPGALRFDYDQKICDLDSSLPHMMPSLERFQSEVRKLGINSDSKIVVYDDVGVYASPRAWWMFRAMGHDRVTVLDGGLPAWIDAGCETAAALEKETRPGNFQARAADNGFCDFAVVLKALDDPQTVILDARSQARFDGTAPEPRPNLRSGHMPGAKNLPCVQVLADGHLKTAAELKKIFQPLVQEQQQLITSCGSGITACILTLAANRAGHENLSVYDASWAEWGMPSKLPVATD